MDGEQAWQARFGDEDPIGQLVQARLAILWAVKVTDTEDAAPHQDAEPQ